MGDLEAAKGVAGSVHMQGDLLGHLNPGKTFRKHSRTLAGIRNRFGSIVLSGNSANITAALSDSWPGIASDSMARAWQDDGAVTRLDRRSGRMRPNVTGKSNARVRGRSNHMP